MRKQIKAIIFDCDGTLVDSEKSHLTAWQEVAKNYTSTLSHEDYLDFVGGSDARLAKILAKRIGHDYPEELLVMKRNFFLEHLKKGMPPIEGTVSFVKTLFNERERHGLKMAVASAALKHEVLENIKCLGFENLFDIVLSGHEDLSEYSDPEGVNKPKPYIYQHAAKILGVLPSECVVIEDSHTGVTAGVNAGCITIAIPSEYSKTHDLSKASLRLDSLSGFTIDSFLEMVHEL
ncbi:MAG: HAD family phosphatase [Chlamydiae bacterium]|jgi:beta-phosphoglucomutase-like phosphatase (HAD superfamily)|nr:HAD family phosphatase [Chlamydiota bacterium]